MFSGVKGLYLQAIHMTQVKPDPQSEASKKQQVEQMFDSISSRYDFLNRFLSAGIDRGWRKKVRKHLSAMGHKYILDVATGTGDLAIELTKIPDTKIVGVDISNGMLDQGRVKIISRKLADRISMVQADSESLPYADNTFDAATVAFGVRNFEHLDKGLAEMSRVIKPGGHILVLEFSKPATFPVKQAYWFYFKYILPNIGRLFSGSKNAYTYLPQSVAAFPEGKAFIAHLTNNGFKQAKAYPLTFGICSLYIAEK